MRYIDSISGDWVFNALIGILDGGVEYGLVIFRDDVLSLGDFDRFHCPVRQNMNKRDGL